MNGRRHIYGIMRTVAPLAVLIALSFLAAGCSKAGGAGGDDAEEGAVIAFSGQAPKTRSGAGSTVTDTETLLRGKPFGVFGYKSEDDATAFENVFVSSPQEVGWDIDNLNWSYTPKRKWDMSKHYRFRAYWPWSAEIKANSNANLLAVEYKSLTEQYDLLVARASRYPLDPDLSEEDRTKRVPLRFRHALAGLRFEVRYKTGTVAAGLEDYVTEFHVKGLSAVGTMFYGQSDDIPGSDGDSISWIVSENTFDDSSEMFSWSGRRRLFSGNQDEDGSVSGSETATVFDGDGTVFVIPQKLSPSATRKTTANFRTEGGGDAMNTAILPQTALEPGKIYTFTLIIHASYVTVGISIRDWDTLQSNVDINL